MYHYIADFDTESPTITVTWNREQYNSAISGWNDEVIEICDVTFVIVQEITNRK